MPQVKYVNKKGETMAAMDVPVDRYVYFAFEDAGIDVPIINRARMCRNGCCTTCAVMVKEGKVSRHAVCPDTAHFETGKLGFTA